MGNVAAVNETLANSSIDEIERMALEAEAKGKQGEQDAAATDEQDVSASSGQTEEQKTAGKNESEAQAKDTDKDTDKETNFAKLRTKLEAQERETQRLAEENKRLAARQYVAELPEDHAEKVAAVDAMIAEIGSKFQEGEITFEEMQSQTRAANTDRELLLAASIKAQISKEMQEQREKEAEEQAALSREDAIKLWEEKQAEFISSKPDSVDYDTDEAKRNSLNTYVKALAADPDNDSKPMEWFLTEAHALVKSKFGVTSSKPAVFADSKGQSQSSPINTLSDLPGGITAARDEVEQFDQMGGAALTNRFLNMTQAQIDAELAKLG